MLGLGLVTESEEAPPWFADVLFALDEYSNVAVAAGGAVVGFEADGAATHAYARIAEKMRERGWTEVGSGLAGNGAFVKDGGKLQLGVGVVHRRVGRDERRRAMRP